MPLPILTAPLRYLIGVEEVEVFEPGAIVEVPYQTQDGETQYCNLRDEKERFDNLADANKRGKFKPYLPGDDITDEYGEFCPDPDGDGFLKNVDEQIAWALAHKAKRIEFDNPDTKGLKISAVLEVQDRCWAKGLRTIAKNPLLTSDPARYTSHPSVDLCIVERGDFGSDDMEALRKMIGQPMLAVRFVACNNEDGDGGPWARAVAQNIKAKGYRNMAVTMSPNGEYTSSQDIQVPL